MTRLNVCKNHGNKNEIKVEKVTQYLWIIKGNREIKEADNGTASDDWWLLLVSFKFMYVTILSVKTVLWRSVETIFYRFLFEEEADNINDSNKEGINTWKSSMPFSFSSLQADIFLEVRKHVFLKKPNKINKWYFIRYMYQIISSKSKRYWYTEKNCTQQ